MLIYDTFEITWLGVVPLSNESIRSYLNACSLDLELRARFKRLEWHLTQLWFMWMRMLR